MSDSRDSEREMTVFTRTGGMDINEVSRIESKPESGLVHFQ